MGKLLIILTISLVLGLAAAQRGAYSGLFGLGRPIPRGSPGLFGISGPRGLPRFLGRPARRWTPLSSGGLLILPREILHGPRLLKPTVNPLPSTVTPTTDDYEITTEGNEITTEDYEITTDDNETTIDQSSSDSTTLDPST